MSDIQDEDIIPLKNALEHKLSRSRREYLNSNFLSMQKVEMHALTLDQ